MCFFTLDFSRLLSQHRSHTTSAVPAHPPRNSRWAFRKWITVLLLISVWEYVYVQFILGGGKKTTTHNSSLMPSLCWECSISSVLVWGSVYRLFSKLTTCCWKTNCGHFSFLSITFLYVWNILSTQNSRNSGTCGTTIFENKWTFLSQTFSDSIFSN